MKPIMKKLLPPKGTGKQPQHTIPEDAQWVAIPARPCVWRWKVLKFDVMKPIAMTKLLNQLEESGYMIWGITNASDGAGVIVARAYRSQVDK